MGLESLLSKRTLLLGGIVELLIYIRCPMDQSVSDLKVLGDCLIVAKANSGKGSFGGTSAMDIAVLHKLLSIDVSYYTLTT